MPSTQDISNQPYNLPDYASTALYSLETYFQSIRQKRGDEL